MDFEIELKSGVCFSVFGSDYSFDIQYFTVQDKSGDDVFVIKSCYLKKVKAIYPQIDSDGFYKSRVIFHAM